MNSNNSVQPIYILPQDTQRTTGKTAQRNNIEAAKLVAEAVRTTLGPMGMDKMLVDSLGDIIVTNDGVTILKEMHIEHPSAKMIVEVAKTQETEVGDGTTTAVILAGELLRQAEELLDSKIHPTSIIKGYRLAHEEALRILESIAQKLDIKDKKTLFKIASTAMTGKGAENAKGHLAQLCVDAVLRITQENSSGYQINLDDIKIEKSVGSAVSSSELVSGIILDKEVVNASMPKHVNNAKILLIDSSIEVKSTETDAKIQITDPNQLQSFLDMEEKMVKDMVKKIASTGARVVFCQKGIDDIAQYFLAKAGILAVRRVKKSDMEKLAKATGAITVSNFDSLEKNILGQAGEIIEKRVGDENMIFVNKCTKTEFITLLVRGGTEHVAAEAERAIEDALGDLRAAIMSEKVVAGAGACEVELARQLQRFSTKFKGREQLAIKAFAQSLEIVPKTLAENAGLDPIDVLANLKSEHDKKQIWGGLNVFTGKVMDAWKQGVLEPIKIKTQAISSAGEVAEMILRIDDVILSSPVDEGPGGNPGDMMGQ